MGENSIASRSGRIPGSATRPSVPPPPITCNRCRKALTTTVFLCSCDCVFCEECTYDHFNENSNCPSCNRHLGEDDITELCVSAPSAATSNTRKASFQNLFTKQSSSSQAMLYPDMCMRLLKQIDDGKSGIRFVLKQMIGNVKNLLRRNAQLNRGYQQARDACSQLKQQAAQDRLVYDKNVEELQNKLQSRENLIAELQSRLDEKENQIRKFRQIHQNMNIPSPSSNHLSGQKRDRSRELIPASAQQPPLQGFIAKKQSEDRARQHSIAQSLGRGLSSRRRSPGDQSSYITPIQRHTSRRPHSGGSHSTPDSARGIRDFSSSFLSENAAGLMGHQHSQHRRSPSMSYTHQVPTSSRGSSFHSSYRRR